MKSVHPAEHPGFRRQHRANEKVNDISIFQSDPSLVLLLESGMSELTTIINDNTGTLRYTDSPLMLHARRYLLIFF